MINKKVKKQVTTYLKQVEERLKDLFDVDVFLTAKETGTGVIVAPYADDAWDSLKTAVADYYNTTWVEIVESGRKAPYPEIRACYCYIGSTYLPYKSLHQIANLIGGKDHTTVIHCVKKFGGYVEVKDKEALSAIKTITEKLRLSNHALKTH